MGKETRLARPRDWLAKTSAGTLLGLALAFGCSALFSHFSTGLLLPIRAQLAMWMVTPIWLGILSGVYLFDSGARAWLWLGGATLCLYAVLALVCLP